MKSSKWHEKKKHQTFSFSLIDLAFWFFFVLFFHVVCKVSFNRWTVKHLAQASLTELTFLEKCRILFCCTSWISVPNELFPIQYVTSPSRETSEFCIQLKCNHPVQKLKDNLDKYPRTFDSCFLSYMIDTYIKTLK